MQAPSPQSHTQTESDEAAISSEMSPIRSALITALHHEQLRTPIPSAALKLTSQPLVILIDADTLSELDLIEILNEISEAEPECLSIISANRPLLLCQRWSNQNDVSIEFHQAPLGADEADLALMRRSDVLLAQDQYSAALILTQDRDLIEIAIRWRRARRPAFLIPLRQDATANALLKRCSSSTKRKQSIKKA